MLTISPLHFVGRILKLLKELYRREGESYAYSLVRKLSVKLGDVFSDEMVADGWRELYYLRIDKGSQCVTRCAYILLIHMLK